MAPASDVSDVLVTGYAGFTGRHLVAFLRRQSPPPRVIGLDARRADDVGADEVYVGNVGDVAATRRLLAVVRPRAIIHLAGRMPPASDSELWLGNVGATFGLLEAVRDEAPEARVLLVGSAAEYGPTPLEPVREDQPCHPNTVYGRSKLAQTLLGRQVHQAFHLPILSARPFNLFGPNMPPRTVIGEIGAQLVAPDSDRRIRLGNLDSARDFLDVRDAVAAYWALAQCGRPGEVYNVCTGRAVTVRELAERLIRLAGGRHEVQFEPGRLKSNDVDYSCGDGSKLTEHTGWRPRIDLDTSLRDTLASLQTATHDRAPQR